LTTCDTCDTIIDESCPRRRRSGVLCCPAACTPGQRMRTAPRGPRTARIRDPNMGRRRLRRELTTDQRDRDATRCHGRVGASLPLVGTGPFLILWGGQPAAIEGSAICSSTQSLRLPETWRGSAQPSAQKGRRRRSSALLHSHPLPNRLARKSSALLASLGRPDRVTEPIDGPVAPGLTLLDPRSRRRKGRST